MLIGDGHQELVPQMLGEGALALQIEVDDVWRFLKVSRGLRDLVVGLIRCSNLEDVVVSSLYMF